MATQSSAGHDRNSSPGWIKWPLILVAVGFCGLMLFVPLAAIFASAFSEGWSGFIEVFKDPHTVASIKVTILTAAIAVPLNIVFGIAASWAIAKFEFPGKSLLLTLIDLPFGVSPIISGMIFILLLGQRSVIGGWLEAHDIKIIFALPGIVIVTTFVTFPYVARELIPLMMEQGSDEEQAAVSLGAGGWQTFRLVTLPNIRWGLLYGVILCNARAMGEFGAVMVVAANVRGGTNTVPMQIENLYSDYAVRESFSLATLLALLGVVTLGIKVLLERRIAKQQQLFAAAGAE
ncbi:MAG: sulfate ABC transporter permease subunit CysW [Pirellulales bacterium]